MQLSSGCSHTQGSRAVQPCLFIHRMLCQQSAVQVREQVEDLMRRYLESWGSRVTRQQSMQGACLLSCVCVCVSPCQASMAVAA